MLSNPTTLHQRQRQHRRQQSTPTAFDAPNVLNLQPIRPNGSHRRGMSLDQRQRRRSPQQEQSVSITNQGFQQTQQHILREAQQQRLARQGPVQQHSYLNYTNDENYIISPQISPQRQSFDSECGNNGSQLRQNSQYNFGPADTSMWIDTIQSNRDSTTFSRRESLTPSAYLNFPSEFDGMPAQQDWNSTVRANSKPSSKRRVSGGIAGRVAQFEGMAEEPSSRPITPHNQNAPSYFPLTPVTTPFNRQQNVQPTQQRYLDSYDTSMEETLKADPRSRSNQRAKTIFQEMREEAERNTLSSPSQSSSVPSRARFDSAPMPTPKFMSMSNMNLDFKQEPSPFYSPITATMSPERSQHSSPEMTQAVLFGDPFQNKPRLDTTEASFAQPSSPTSNTNPYTSPYQGHEMRRSESVDSLNLDEAVTDTGITIDDIANYISGPDPVDQKWLCLFPECKKKFGRKENIKSHVQTHLGDRQYQCPHCRKCFVRQHDLKRHAKIHSGVKPYPCACGNSFARHDALTRHRQRGMCIGAFEGVVKKVVKRGRPRKNRLDNEDRLDKSARTRSKNKSTSAPSSSSEYSESSYGSPRAEFDVLDDKPFGDFTNFSQPIQDPNNLQYTGMSSSIPADYVSPQAIVSAASPSAFSTHSFHSQHSHHGSITHSSEEQPPYQAGSPAHSVASPSQSQYNTPPELYLSSSSPAAQSTSQYYNTSEQSDDLDLILDNHLSQNELEAQLAMSPHDDSFLDAFGAEDPMTRLEQESDLLMLNGKFDENFMAVVGDDHGMGMGMDMSVFDNSGNDDVFFGSP